MTLLSHRILIGQKEVIFQPEQLMKPKEYAAEQTLLEEKFVVWEASIKVKFSNTETQREINITFSL